MRLLLDTHALLWWLDGDRRLSRRARTAIADQHNTILVSAVSAWEITTKARLGKLPGAVAVAADVAGAVASQGFSPLDITLRGGVPRVATRTIRARRVIRQVRYHREIGNPG